MAELRVGRLVPGADTVSEAYDGLAPTYDGLYLSPKDVAENVWLTNHLRRGGYTSGHVIDVGCGTGLLLEMIDIPPERYMGIDVSGGMLAQARSKFPSHRFYVGNMEDLAGLHGLFDSALYLFGTFSYALHPEVTVRTLASLLVSGGRFLVMLLSDRYPDRASYSVAKAGYKVPLVTYDKQDALALFSGPTFTDVRVRGLSMHVDRLNWLGPTLVTAYYHAEAATLGRLMPSKASYVVVEGRRA